MCGLLVVLEGIVGEIEYHFRKMIVVNTLLLFFDIWADFIYQIKQKHIEIY